MDIVADHFGTLQNPKMIALFLSVEQIYTRVGFTGYQHVGQHCIGQKSSYRFVAPNRPCHYVSPYSPVTDRSMKRRKKQLMVFNRVSWKNVTLQGFSIKASIAWTYCQEQPIHDNNTFIHVSKLLVLSWMNESVWLILILVIFNWDHLPKILISLCFDVSLFLLIS